MRASPCREFSLPHWLVGPTVLFLATLAACLFLTSPRAGAMEMTDQAISDAIEDEWSLDPAVPSVRVQADTRDGIVTLTGWVPNLMAKERVARIAETVKGVRAVVNNIAVHVAQRKPQDLIDDVGQALADDPATDSWQISAKADDNGMVILGGTVDSWQERELAIIIVKGVRGVSAVDNRIDIKPAAHRSDRDIAADIMRTLRWDGLVDHELIEVAVDDSKVWLSGVVGSAAEWQRARQDAWTAGVTSVDTTDLVVAKWTRDPALRTGKYVIKSDEDVQEALVKALRADPRVPSEDLQITVLAGTATLRGTVASVDAKRVATDDARNTVGVHDIVNRLRVIPKEAIADDALAGKIRKALSRDPYVDRFDIVVAVVNGLVYLDGKVDNAFEKARADVVAGRLGGVIEVVNNLDVRRTAVPYAYEPNLERPGAPGLSWHAYRPPMTIKSDAKIKAGIERQLWWSPFVDSDAITVTVEDGVATLTGRVHSWPEYTSAVENAFEGGAIRVVDDLEFTNDQLGKATEQPS
jgi:Predicted periplasmic or secreted lipoprotein